WRCSTSLRSPRSPARSRRAWRTDPGPRTRGMQDLDAIGARAAAEFAAAGDPASLETAKAKFLGKTGELTALLKQLGSLAAEEKKSFGQRINTAKQQIKIGRAHV